MDPNANLEQQLDLARALQMDCDRDEGIYTTDELAVQAYALAEHVTALHEWLVKGGATPDAWGQPGAAQGRALQRLMVERKSSVKNLSFTPFDLPLGYWGVTFHDGFQCGIAPDGSVSS